MKLDGCCVVHDTHENPFTNVRDAQTGEILLVGKPVSQQKHNDVFQLTGNQKVIWFAIHFPICLQDEHTRQFFTNQDYIHPSFANSSRYGGYRVMVALQDVFKALGGSGRLSFQLVNKPYGAETSLPIVVRRRTNMDTKNQELFSHELCQQNIDGTFSFQFFNYVDSKFQHFEFCVVVDELRFSLKNDSVRLYKVAHNCRGCIETLRIGGKLPLCPDVPTDLEDSGHQMKEISFQDLFHKPVPSTFEALKVKVRVVYVDSPKSMAVVQALVEQACTDSPHFIIMYFKNCSKIHKGDEIAISCFYRKELDMENIQDNHRDFFLHDSDKLAPFYMIVDRHSEVSRLESSQFAFLKDTPTPDFKNWPPESGVKQTVVESCLDEIALDPEQQSIIDAMKQSHNILIHGWAGTGKSVVINRAKQELRKANKRFRIAATTGAASAQIEGYTIHSLAGINCDKVMEYIFWKTLDVLIVDEISMLGAHYLLDLNKKLQKLRGNTETFGGIQVLVFGDFLQLPPVESQYPLLNNEWRKLFGKRIDLTKIYRQRENQDKLRNVLDILRSNKDLFSSQRSLNTFMQKAAFNTTRKKDIKYKDAIFIVTTNRSAEYYNTNRLQQFEKERRFLFQTRTQHMVELVIGCTVTLRQNLSPTLVNGLQGTVVDIVRKKPKLNTGYWQQEMASKHFSSVENGTVWYPKVQFDNGEVEIIPYYISHEEGNYKRWMPLSIGYARTVHSCQGLTIDRPVYFDLKYLCHPALLYVALSRVTKFEYITFVLEDGDSDLEFNWTRAFYSKRATYCQLIDLLQTKNALDSSVISSPDKTPTRKRNRESSDEEDSSPPKVPKL